MNLVVGSTGLLGMEICRQLADAGKPLRALIRETSNPEKVEKLKSWGAEIVIGDLKHRQSLRDACRGVNAVISTASSTFSRQEGDTIKTVDEKGQLNLVEAAVDNQVKKFVLISFPKSAELLSPLASAKQKVEDALINSKLNYTIFHANFFTEVWLSSAVGFDFPNAQVTVYGDGRQKLSWISYIDVAKFAVAAIDNSAADHAILPLGGPEALSPLEVAGLFENAMAKKIEVKLVPREALLQQKSEAQDPLQESFAALMIGYSYGMPMDMRPLLDKIPLNNMKTVQDYINEVVNKEKAVS